MRAKQAPPLLRRTASGHLFQPADQVRRGGEIGRRIHVKEHVSGKERAKHGWVDAVCGAMEAREGSRKATNNHASSREAEHRHCSASEPDREDAETSSGETEENAGADDIWLEIAQEMSRC
jgi:hypothetical protein